MGGTPLSSGWGTPVLTGGTPNCLGWGGPGVPPVLILDGGTPVLILDGVPHISRMGYPPVKTWDRVPPPHQHDGVPPILILDGGTPYPDLGWGTPHQQDGVPPLSRPGMGYTPVINRMGYPPPHPDLRWGTLPPPPRKCGQTENITFPHPSDAGGKKVQLQQKVSHADMGLHSHPSIHELNVTTDSRTLKSLVRGHLVNRRHL